MIVELLGGPFDGDQAELDDNVGTIVLMRPDFAMFIQPAGKELGGLPHGYEKAGEYIANELDCTPATFTWHGD